MKTVVMVDRGVGFYRTPNRGRGCMVKAAGAPAGCDHPHIVFMNEYGSGKFLKFGTSTPAVVIQNGGIFGNNPGQVMDLGRALSTNRLESVLVITCDKTCSSPTHTSNSSRRRSDT